MRFKQLILTVSCLFILSFTKAQNKAIKWVVSENSNLIVHGSTNLTSFQCIIPSFPQADTIKIAAAASPKNIPLTGVIKLQVANFDCKNAWMTKELRKTLKQSQFPYLEVKFLSLSNFPDFRKSNSTVIGTVEIQLAGAIKRYEINFELDVDASNIVYLSAIKDVNFTDFKIVPPTKMGKMVQTRDKLTVELSLAMKIIQ
jgi:hypothetical protein